MTFLRTFIKAFILLTLSVVASRAADQPAIDVKLTQALYAAMAQCPDKAYQLSRSYSVGDEAVMRVSDIFSKVQTGTLTLNVTRVDANADRVELNGGEWLMNLKGNFVKTPESGPKEAIQLIAPDALRIGNTWSAIWVEQGVRGFGPMRLDMKVAALEKVSVPAGDFDAFRIEVHGWFGKGLPVTRRYWVVPGLNFPVRYEHILEGPTGQGRTLYFDAEYYELVSLRQQALEIKCLPPK